MKSSYWNPNVKFIDDQLTCFNNDNGWLALNNLKNSIITRDIVLILADAILYHHLLKWIVAFSVPKISAIQPFMSNNKRI